MKRRRCNFLKMDICCKKKNGHSHANIHPVQTRSLPTQNEKDLYRYFAPYKYTKKKKLIDNFRLDLGTTS